MMTTGMVKKMNQTILKLIGMIFVIVSVFLTGSVFGAEVNNFEMSTQQLISKASQHKIFITDWRNSEIQEKFKIKDNWGQDNWIIGVRIIGVRG